MEKIGLGTAYFERQQAKGNREWTLRELRGPFLLFGNPNSCIYMNIKIMRPCNGELMPVYRQVGLAAMSRFSSMMLVSDGVVVSVDDWSAFLSAVWSAYAECSRSSLGALMSVPLRVRLLDFEAETWVSYDSECGGIRYKSLVRYGSC